MKNTRFPRDLCRRALGLHLAEARPDEDSQKTHRNTGTSGTCTSTTFVFVRPFTLFPQRNAELLAHCCHPPYRFMG